jgi:hypothetical protein
MSKCTPGRTADGMTAAELCRLAGYNSMSECPIKLQELAGLAEWQPPQAGMFLWLRLLRPPADEQRLVDALQDQRVVVVPGACRTPNPKP